MAENNPLLFHLRDRVSIRGGHHDGVLGTIVSGLKGTVESENLIDGFYRYHIHLDGGLGFVLMAPRYLYHLPEAQQVDLATGVALTVIRGEMQFSDASTEAGDSRPVCVCVYSYMRELTMLMKVRVATDVVTKDT
jgi:hypothetical protein